MADSINSIDTSSLSKPDRIELEKRAANDRADLAEMWRCASELAALDRRRRVIERDRQRALR